MHHACRRYVPVMPPHSGHAEHARTRRRARQRLRGDQAKLTALTLLSPGPVAIDPRCTGKPSLLRPRCCRAVRTLGRTLGEHTQTHWPTHAHRLHRIWARPHQIRMALTSGTKLLVKRGEPARGPGLSASEVKKKKRRERRVRWAETE